ncbi:MAG: hypothetical protein V8T62_09320 [Oscillospiraceae bacterium]|nr:hypothetical protein [Oscillospiraceae bacterium]MDD7041296.1 hypothetical protein [Oscillospiraceae bacterium]MDY2611507.1 hypothetical protein [Oscillospiraceae bacterium]
MEQKKSIFDLKKSWQWMAYIYFILPVIMFILGWLMGDNDMGKFFSGLFHAYNLYIMNPLLDFGKKMGIIGILIPLVLFGWAIKRKDYIDLAISVGIEALVVLYFWQEWNYLVIGPLHF